MMKLFSEYSQSAFEPSGVILFLSRIWLSFTPFSFHARPSVAQLSIAG